MFGCKGKPNKLSTEEFNGYQIEKLTRGLSTLADAVTALEMKVAFLGEPKKECCKSKKRKR